MAHNSNINELFKKEISVLKNAVANVENEKYKNNELMSDYKKITKEYNKLLILTKKILKISDSQDRDIKRREFEIKNLLDHSNQGFLTFGKDLLIGREYSSECYRIFNKKIANINVLELLSSENEEQNQLFRQVFESIFDSSSRECQQSKLARLPNMIKINENFINIQYRYIYSNEFQETKDQIMLILTDITEKRKAEDRVLFLSYHDKLTALYNRTYIDSIMPQLLSQSNLPFSIILADMNGLKLTNDVFGHESGDKLLISAAQVFKSSCRKSDIIARWGGDEFLILLPGADSNTCSQICARIKETCNQTESDPIQLSFSLGTATVETVHTDVASLINVAENVMYNNKLTESKTTRKKIIFSVEKILYSKCFEDKEHVERLKFAAGKFAKFLNIESDSKEMSNLLLLARLHNIGKVAVSREILGKTGRLTQAEWKIIKSCPEVGYRMAQSIDEPVLAKAILAICEHWNGNGYPNGLKEEQIPLISRIISIIDAFDVMTHGRPYKKKMSHAQAIQEIASYSGTQFDPRLVKVFLDNIHEIYM